MRLIDADALIQDLAKWLKQVDPTHPQEVNAIPPMEDIIVSTIMTIEEQPTIEPEYTNNSISAPCQNCSNHPMNGGTGICHCTLGCPTIT